MINRNQRRFDSLCSAHKTMIFYKPAKVWKKPAICICFFWKKFQVTIGCKKTGKKSDHKKSWRIAFWWQYPASTIDEIQEKINKMKIFLQYIQIMFYFCKKFLNHVALYLSKLPVASQGEKPEMRKLPDRSIRFVWIACVGAAFDRRSAIRPTICQMQRKPQGYGKISEFELSNRA